MKVVSNAKNLLNLHSRTINCFFNINRILIDLVSCLKVGSFGRIDYFCENQVAMAFKCIWKLLQCWMFKT